MTQVSTIHNPTTMKESIAAALNTINGTKLKSKDLKNQKLTEEQLLLAATHQSASRISAATGKQFLKAVKEKYQQLKSNGEKYAIFKAIEAEVKNLAKTGTITDTKAERIMLRAVGRSDLDNRVSHLSTSKTQLTDKTGKDVRTNIDVTVQRFNSNQWATEGQLTKLRKQVYGDTQPTQPTSGQPATEDPPVVVTPSPEPTPTPKYEPTGPNDMAWYPQTEETENAVFILPTRYSELVNRVTVVDKDGNQVAELDGNWKGSDGRRNFRADRKGSDFGANITFVLHFLDGTSLDENISNPNGFWKNSYVD